MIHPSIRKNKLSYSVEILMNLMFSDTVTTFDVIDMFYISESHASNVLRQMWRKGWLSRKIEYVKPHGRRYRYFMTSNGFNLLRWLDSKGKIEPLEPLEWK